MDDSERGQEAVRRFRASHGCEARARDTGMEKLLPNVATEIGDAPQITGGWLYVVRQVLDRKCQSKVARSSGRGKRRRTYRRSDAGGGTNGGEKKGC
ncbi:hypothetical protein PHSY_000553 [Pseudozyma hubeiensis SY62]|uniref:Uncharacterized protein n=1 Tax=Pseudozyma hubeiensis (strain SY62) TaxID=1305764 RepID=R9NWJ9_PSEHS|nr:hypothetical protein PHSY_000553 [Pseudozyma hubeiensis SY62]GAC92993.1 hypothetical protein PHSY_000553 [Pseudozyma hubeiensis SY62]